MKTKLCASVTLIQNHSWECTLVGRHTRGNVRFSRFANVVSNSDTPLISHKLCRKQAEVEVEIL